MCEFSLNSKYLENIRKTVEKFPEYRDRIGTIRINETFDIEVPVIVAASLSSTITKIIDNDPTASTFCFTIQRYSETSFSKLKDVLQHNTRVSLDNDDDIHAFAEFGLCAENDDFVSPLKSQLCEYSSDITEDNVLKIISSKNTFRIDDNTNEYSFVASNFESMSTREDFIEFAKKDINRNSVKDILSRDDLCMSSEDTLLTFILRINEGKSEENITTDLFPFLLLEYCSPSKCEEFLRFSCSVIQNESFKSLLTCIGRRFVQSTIPMNPAKLKGRHEPSNKSNTADNRQEQSNEDKYTEIGKEDPHRGIFRRENEKGNTTLSASSYCNGDINDLLNADDDSYFLTENEPNSFITASLKDGKSFIVKSYMIRGNKYDDDGCQLQSWKLEGQKASDGQWVTLDSHQNDPTRQLQTRTFDVSCDEKLKAVKLTATGKDTNGCDYLRINAFDVFGLLFE